MESAARAEGAAVSIGGEVPLGHYAVIAFTQAGLVEDCAAMLAALPAFNVEEHSPIVGGQQQHGSGSGSGGGAEGGSGDGGEAR